MNRLAWEISALSVLVILGTGGISYIWQLAQIRRIGRRADKKPVNSAVLLVPGKCLRHGHIDPEYRQRLDAAARAIHTGCTRRLIILGGGQPSEASVGHDYLLDRHGLKDFPIELDERSTNTWENIVEARHLINIEPGDAISLVSNRYHLPRCLKIARAQGLSIHVFAAMNEPPAPAWRDCVREAWFMHLLWVGLPWTGWVHPRELSALMKNG